MESRGKYIFIENYQENKKKAFQINKKAEKSEKERRNFTKKWSTWLFLFRQKSNQKYVAIFNILVDDFYEYQGDI